MRADLSAGSVLLWAALCSGPLIAQRTREPEPFVLGVTEVIRSTALGEDRTLNIYLPFGYSADSAATYPVIYLIDGSADEDFIHVSGAVQFASYPWIEWVRPSIVVGIANVDRKRDLTFPTSVAEDKEQFSTTGGSAGFMRFLGDELIPFIDGNYHTSPDRMLIGQSLGGLFATEVLLKRPELFSRYLIVSPSLWWDNGSLLKVAPAFAANKDKAPRSVYIAVGKEGKGMVGPAKKFAALIRKQPEVRVGFKYFPEFGHADPLHGAVMDGFRWMGQGTE